MNHPAIPSGWNEDLDGPTMRKYCKIALDNRIWLSLGGFQETCHQCKEESSMK
jgi:hypothetical protein